MKDTSKIDRLIARTESELKDLEVKRSELLARISSLKARRDQLLIGGDFEDGFDFFNFF
ncbi:MAG: hypothetical protein JW883_16585 [Deltaproteobacteria bacterium]|nr:hypothetical protein [Deltaproteobacteria bacterium]